MALRAKPGGGSGKNLKFSAGPVASFQVAHLFAGGGMKITNDAHDFTSNALASSSTTRQVVAQDNTLASTTTQSSYQTPESGVSSDALWLNATQQELATTSDVDMEKVQQLQQAIANGELVLDTEALSEAILEMHRS
jgi:negative regulator of flagellin synthesis FlgM